jgi:hypothetical protein
MRGKNALLLLMLALFLPLGSAWATTCGSAYFNHEINYPSTSDLYFSVAGSPANTCGDLWAWRNGNGFNMEAAGWICTDGQGQATKGPWSASSHSTDETAYAYIDWGTCESNVVTHIWDVTPPVPQITSNVPSAFSGTASDGSWGAGFDSHWAYCLAEYYDATSGRWWTAGTGSYSETSNSWASCSLSGMPSLSVSWSASQLPSSHQGGHHYYWTIWVFDGGQWGTSTTDFVY